MVKLRSLPDSFFEAKYAYYFGPEDSPSNWRWKAFCRQTMVADPDISAEQKGRFLQKIIANSSDLQKLARADQSLKPDPHQPVRTEEEQLDKSHPQPVRTEKELRSDLRHFVFRAALIYYRFPDGEPIRRWKIEAIAQKLRAMAELGWPDGGISDSVLRLEGHEEKIVDREVTRLHKAGKLKFTRWLWRETGLSSLRHN